MFENPVNPENPRRHFRKLRGRGRPAVKRRFKMTTTLYNGKKAKTSFVATKNVAFAKANYLVGKKYHGSQVKHVTLDYQNKPERASTKKAYKRKRKAPKSTKAEVGVIPSLFGFDAPRKSAPKKRKVAKKAPRKVVRKKTAKKAAKKAFPRKKKAVAPAPVTKGRKKKEGWKPPKKRR